MSLRNVVLECPIPQIWQPQAVIFKCQQILHCGTFYIWDFLKLITWITYTLYFWFLNLYKLYEFECTLTLQILQKSIFVGLNNEFMLMRSGFRQVMICLKWDSGLKKYLWTCSHQFISKTWFIILGSYFRFLIFWFQFSSLAWKNFSLARGTIHLRHLLHIYFNL